MQTTDKDQEVGEDNEDNEVGAEEKASVFNDWKNPPKIGDLTADFDEARTFQQAQVGKIKGWLNNLNVTGSAVHKGPAGSSKIQPKLIRKQAEWRYAALSEPFLSTKDLFKVRPVTWEDRKAAQQNQLVLNNQINSKIPKVAFIDELVRTAVDEGTVIVKVGWDFYEEEYKEEVPTFDFAIDPSIMPVLEQVAQLQQSSPSQYQTDVPDELKQAFDLLQQTGQPYAPRQTGTETVSKKRTIRNQPCLEICNYQNITIDPTCEGDINKAKFVIRTFETSMAQLKEDGKYKNLDGIRLSTNSPLAEPDHVASDGSRVFAFKDEPRAKVVVHEYWGYWDIDKSGFVKPIVAAWIGQTLIRMEENPFPDKKIPFVVGQYLPVRNSVYGEPDGVLIEDNQKIAGAVTRGMIDIMGKSAAGQMGMRKDALDLTNRRKYDRGENYEFNQNVDARQAIYMHTYPEIPNSAQFMLQLQNMEAESLTGVKSFSSGISGNALGEVAAGVRGALDAASKRELGILRRLSALMEEIGRRIIAMNAIFLDEEEVVRITNEEFVAVRKDDLPGNFDLELGISTAEEDEKKAQELAFMLQTMGNNMDADMTHMILSDIARLRKMPELAEKIENYQPPPPDPIMQERAQLENEMLKAQIQEILAKAQQAGAHSALTATKVGTEQAKAQHIQADTDKKNLDFVEQESGVKQERELQKQGAQAEANAGLEVVKHQLNETAANTQLIRDYAVAKAAPKA